MTTNPKDKQVEYNKKSTEKTRRIRKEEIKKMKSAHRDVFFGDYADEPV